MIKWQNEVEVIRDLLDKGITIEDIGIKYDVSKQRIYQVMTKFNLDTNVRKRKSFLKDKDKSVYWLNRMLCTKGFNNVDRKYLLDNLNLPKTCPMLGIKLNYGGTGVSGWSRGDDSPSIDKIIPELGYTKDNIQVISWRANRIKNDSTFEEFELMYKYWKSLTKKHLQL